MSFSAEMKDFLNAYKTGQSINASRTDQDYKDAQTDATKKKTERDNDPETLALQDKQSQANLAKTNAGIALTNEQVKNAGVSRGYTAELTNRLKQAREGGGAADAGGGIGLAQDGYGNAAPAVGGIGPTAGPPLQNTMVPAYAGGGIIPDEADDGDGDPAVSDELAGTPEQTPPGAATDVSARSRGGQSGLPQGGFNGVVAPTLIHDAVRGAYDYGTKAAGLGRGGVQSPRSRAAAQALAQGAGGLSHQEMEMARKAVDPEGKLSDSQRNMAALGSVYQFYANKGEPEKAQKVAFQMLQNFRLASQRYAALAAHAAEQGNMDLATKAAVKAYANVPDGRDMMIQYDPENKRVNYMYTDENGKTIKKGLATPEELASSAMGLARGGFDQAILSAAGQREEAQKATATKGTPKGNPLKDMKDTGAMLDEAITPMQEKWQKKNEGKEVDQQYWTGLKNAATHAIQQNPKMTPDEALSSVQTLMDPKKSDFKTTSENGQNTIRFGDGKKITLDDENFDALITQRAAMRKQQEASDKQAKEDASKPTRLDQAVGGAKRIGGAVGDIAGEAGQAIGAAGEGIGGALKRGAEAVIPDETIQRGRSGLRQAGQYLGDLGQRFSNPGAIPTSPDDRPL